MITLQELCEYLDGLLQPNPIKDYGLNGLQVEGKKEIHKLATAVSSNLASIEAAAAWGADTLIVHHGLFWNQDSYQIKGVKKEKIELLLKNQMSLIAYHLPLDIHQELGNNWKAAMEMGWKDLKPFGCMNGIFLGVKGNFNKLHRQDFQKTLEDYYAHPAHVALGGKEYVETAGLISGGSYKLLNSAIEEELDCYIAGNFDEPAWNQAFEEKINFFALGHSATEKIGPRTLGEHLSKTFHLDVKFIDIYNPF